MFRSSLLSPSLHFLHERSKTENGLFSQPARARSRRGSDLQGREAERIATLDPKGCEERERDRQVSLCVQRRRREQKKNSSSNSPLPPPPKKKNPKQGTAPTPVSSPPLASTASLRRRSPARGPRRRCERWAPSALPCRPRRPPRRKTLLLLLLLPPPGPASPSAPRRASPAPRSSRGRRLWERREEGNELIMTYNRWKEVKEKGRGVKEKRG